MKKNVTFPLENGIFFIFNRIVNNIKKIKKSWDDQNNFTSMESNMVIQESNPTKRNASGSVHEIHDNQENRHYHDKDKKSQEHFDQNSNIIANKQKDYINIKQK